jgi:subtilisin family serine protease
MHNLYLRQGRRALFLSIPVLLSLISAWGQRMDRARAARLLRQPHAEAQFIVKFREVPAVDGIAPYSRGGVRGMQRIGEGAFHLLLTEAGGQDVLASLSEHPEIESIEPNYVITVEKAPNDSMFGQQWGLKNATTVGADVAATAAWDYATAARKTVVAVVDTGVDFNHPDLTANIWSAPRTFTFNGATGTVTCPAGSRGVNAVNSTCVPMDDNGHGTHCAGIIGATGNNTAGVAGVNWSASILPVKFLGATGSGSLTDALRALDAVVQIKKQFGAEANVRVVSASWGFLGNSVSLDTAIAALNAVDILFVAAAGNAAQDNDTTANFPANSTQPNVLSVAATDRNDALATFSNYGAKVHLGAPGVGILSTYPAGKYASMSGTSMAAPFVAGAAGLLLSTCTANTATLRSHLLAGVDMIPTLNGRTATGGRLNVYKSLRRCASPAATLSATPATKTIKAGETATYSLLPSGDGGLSGGGTVTFTGVPASVTMALGGAVALGTPVNLTAKAASTTAAGRYTITATLTASTYKASVPLTLIVQTASSFTLKAVAPTATVKPGTTTAVTIQIARAANFTGAVTVKPQGLPAGVTAAPITLASGQTSANMLINVGPAAAAGSASFNVTGGGGTPLTTATAPVTLTVQAPASLKIAFKQPVFSAKAGSTASLDFSVVASAPVNTMQFQLSGLVAPTNVQIVSVSTGNFRLIVGTTAAWANKSAMLKLTINANGLTSTAAATLNVTR